MDAHSRIPKVVEPLEFEDGLAYLVKTDILREMLYFSYDKSSMADLYALTAAEVQEVIKMNRNGLKPESLKIEPEPVAPEFITSVGDDSITRFDKPARKKGGRGRGGRNGGDGGNRNNGGNRNGGGNRADKNRGEKRDGNRQQKGKKNEA